MDLITSGKGLHFNAPVLADRTCPLVEITAKDVEDAAKVPILTRMQIECNYDGGRSIKHEQTNKDLITDFGRLRTWAETECKGKMEDLIIVADGLVWFDRYDNNYNEVPGYEYIFSNVGIYMWTPKSNRYKLVRVEPVFDLLPLTHRQAVMSYVCCMANLEMEAFNEDLKPDDPTRMVINL